MRTVLKLLILFLLFYVPCSSILPEEEKARSNLISQFSLSHIATVLSKPLKDKLEDLKKNYRLDSSTAYPYRWVDDDEEEALGIFYSSISKADEASGNVSVDAKAVFSTDGFSLFSIERQSVFEPGTADSEILTAKTDALRDVLSGNFVFGLGKGEILRVNSVRYFGEDELPLETLVLRHISPKGEGEPRTFQIVVDSYLVLQIQFFEDDGGTERVLAIVYPQNYNPSPDSEFPMLRRVAECRVGQSECLLEEVYRYYGGEELLRDSEIDVRTFMNDHIIANIVNNLLIENFFNYLIMYFPETERF